MDRIRSDNVKLYEKIKFLQNYSGKKAGAHTRPSSDEMEAQYSAQYEQKLDPFTHFNKTVSRCRAFLQLHLHTERALPMLTWHLPQQSIVT